MRFTQVTALTALFGYVISTAYGTLSAGTGFYRGHSDRTEDYRIDTHATSDARVYRAEPSGFDAAQKLLMGGSQASSEDGRTQESKRFRRGTGGFGVRAPVTSKPYKFGYDARNGIIMNLHRNEQSDEHGNVKGTYGYTDALGHYRTVEYVVDANGFRATIRTNEPGVGRQSPADVVLIHEEKAGGLVGYGSPPRRLAPLAVPIQSTYYQPAYKEPVSYPASGYVRDVDRPRARMFASDGVNTVECGITPKLKALQLLAEKLCKL